MLFWQLLMPTRTFATVVCLAAGLAVASPAAAQYGASPSLSDRATGENYHVEAGIFLWDPTPNILIKSESLGIPGDQIDFVNDLGIEKSAFRQFKITLRPATKHKFRFEYTPIRYTATKSLSTTFVFNGQR